MRDRILNILYREVATTPDTVVSELRKDALLLPNIWTPEPVVKALAWVRYHPLLVHRQLDKLTKEKLTAQNGSRFSLTSIGLSRLGRHNSAAGETQPPHLRLVTS